MTSNPTQVSRSVSTTFITRAPKRSCFGVSSVCVIAMTLQRAMRGMVFISSLLHLVIAESYAHDCFLIAKPYHARSGTPVKIAIHIDDAFPGRHVPWNPERITRFHHWHGRTLLDSVVPEPLEDSSGVMQDVEQAGFISSSSIGRRGKSKLSRRRSRTTCRKKGLNILSDFDKSVSKRINPVVNVTPVT